jgi:DNA modification methylase
MTVAIRIGDCREVLRTLPDESVHCVVTSPPYWGLRDYGTAKWEGGDLDCLHVREIPRGHNSSSTAFPGQYPNLPFKGNCGKCGAIRIDSQIGLEPDLHSYVAAMVEVFREVRRVLRKDGTLWLNLGDSYAAVNRGENARPRIETLTGIQVGNPHSDIRTRREVIESQKFSGIKPKDLCGIPWRIAFALQEDGWYLRQDIIWSKPNPMPESVTDRCTKAHEYLFLLSKSERYFYDADAIREEGEGYGRGTDPTGRMFNRIGSGSKDVEHINGGKGHTFEGGRNKRSVWEVARQPFSEAHFATFPPALIEPCIKAGTSAKGCCSKCGAPWVRVVEVESRPNAPSCNGKYDGNGKHRTFSGGVTNDGRNRIERGWSPSCKCDAPTMPCTVLDPFSGAGTTGLVADRLQRSAILIELNPDYSAMSERRIVGDAPLFADVSRETWAQMWAKPFDFSQEPTR